MYSKILVTLDTSSADETILTHIRPLARLCHAKLVLLHVADGWAARHFKQEAASQEVTQDRAYLARLQEQLRTEGFDVETDLAFGNPGTEIVKWVDEKGCDLVAMSTHGHRFLADIIYGSASHHVLHHADVPVLLVRAKDTSPS